ncbi:hypothetical protein F7734_12990 [Scytonema sp. UIC 10036]|uniref:CARDB domain-containing protein n=1 Tax=Scytonema sp. UIC 10036 TaxID=2304196 RepID=UPI0012DADC19|nr:CARDB domain-containing protein [Scytonema sp. UIC 10036]MUG93294.1 hypothetical protein [Scytonema sp. UIC 10036]
MSNNNPINLPFSLIDGDAFPWEITADGELEYGRIATNSDTGEQYFLSYGKLSNDYYGYHSADAYTEDNGREVVIAPRYVGSGYGGDLPISVSRKIYISENSGFVRILDIVTNTYSQRWTYDFTVDNDLPYLQSNVVNTSSGDDILTLDDNWLVVDGIYQEGSLNNTFDMLQVIAGSGGYRPFKVYTSSGADFTYKLDLAPGETQIVMHFIARNSDVATALAKGDQLALLGMNALAGMTEEEKSQVINFDTGVNNNVPPDLVVLNPNAPNTAITGQEIAVSWGVKNQGSGLTSSYWEDNIFISDNTTLDPSDIQLFNQWHSADTPLAVNSSYELTGNIRIPKVTPGQKYLLFVTDGYYNDYYGIYRGNYQGEVNESNNVLAVPIEIEAPDLVISSPIGIDSVILGEKISLSWTVTNQSNVSAPASWYDYVYISSDTRFDNNDTYVTENFTYGFDNPLAGNASYTINKQNITIPITELGDRYLLFITNKSDFQADTNETNNVFAVPIEIKAPDLQISTVQAPQAPVEASWGETISVSWSVINQGEAAAPAKWYDRVLLSSDDELGYDTAIGSKYIDLQTPLAPGASYENTIDITIPNGWFHGSGHLLFVADGSYNYQGETNEANNYVAVPIEIKAPDLKVSEVQALDTAIPGQSFLVSWTVKNQGNGTAFTDWTDYVYLSSNDTYEYWQDTLLTSESITAQTPLAAGESYEIQNKFITIPTTAEGPQYLLFVTDGYNKSYEYYSYYWETKQSETNEYNNVYPVPIQISTPDLSFASAPIAPDTAVLGETISVSWTVKNQSNNSPANADWYDRVYISSDTTLDETDTFVDSEKISKQTPGGNYTIANKELLIPTTMTGPRYLLFITNATGDQGENDKSNNTYAVPIEIKAPDLTVKEAGRPNPGTTTWTASWGQEIPVFWTVKNISDGDAKANWYDRVYISSDDKLNGDTLLYSEYIDAQTPLAAYASYTISDKLITIPNYSNDIRGNQYLLFVTDANQDQGETNEAKGLLETNNVKPVPIFIAAPDLVVESVTAVPSTSAQFGQTINVTYFVSNAGDPGSSTVASRWTDRIWLCKGSTLDSPRIELTPVSVERDTPLNSGTSYSKTVTVPLPLNPQFSNGTYYIWVETDTSYNQVEFNENNNTKFSQPINLTLPTIPDLQVTSVVTPFEGLSGQKLEIVWTIYNGGDKDATGVWHDNVYLSKDGSVGNDDFYASFSFEGTIQAGKPIERRQFIDLPIDLEGERWVVVKTDAGGDVYEHGQESNNTLISSNPIDISKSDFPNLKVSSVTARTDSAFSGQKITLDWVVENTGTGSTSAPIWYDAVFLSLNGQETYLGQTSNFSYLDKYGSGIHSYNNSLEVTLPDNIEGNNYYFVVKTDYYDNVYEYQKEDDNFRSTESPTNIELTPPPDLQLTVNEHSPVFSGQRMTLNWTVVNNGSGKTSQHSWYDEVYMSADPYPGNGDEEYFLGSRYHYGDLDVYDANSTNGATSSYTTSLDVTLPIGVSGNFYFIVRTDAGNQVLEFAGDANNIVAQPTPTIVNLTPPPDLEVELVDVPTQALASHALTIDYRVTNYGSTATPNYSWVDAFYLSQDANFNLNTDRLLGEVTQYGYLDAGIPDDRSVTFTLPDGLSGTFHVFVVTDQRNDVFELNNDNNVNNYNNVGNNVGVVTVSSRPADLVVSAIDVPTTLEAGIASRIKWTVANTGTGDTAVRAWTDSIIASGDTNLGNDDDVVLGSFYHSDTLSLIDGTYRSGLLNPGDFSERNELVTIPFTLSGQYHLFVVTDANAQVYEANALGNNYKSQLITVNRDTPDLQVTGVNATPSVSSTDKLAVNWTVKNFGTGRTNAYSWYDSVYLSTDTQLNSQQDIYLGQVFHSGALDQFGSYDGSGTFNLPIDLKGNYHVIVRTDNSANSEYNDRVLEGSLENNNDKATSNTTAITLGEVPNLVVESVDAPIDAISSQLFNLTWTVRNDGAATGYKRWYDAIYLSRDQNFDRSSDIYLDYRYRVGGLAAGETYTQQNQLFKIPSGLSGPFYVFVVTDGGNEVYERGGEGNTVGNNLNYDRNSVQVSLPNPADLSVGTITVPVNAVPGLDATISYRINNTGPNAAQGIWYDSIYLSADDKWDINDTFFGRSQAPVSYVAAPGNDYSYYDNSITAPLPGVVRGDYHVIVKSDIRNAIVENDENNNIGGSLDKVSIDVESLQLDVSKTGTLFQGQSVYYKIDVALGETLQVTFDSVADNAFNELYIRYGEMPSQTEFDYGFENVSADQQIVVPFTEAGTYYVLARAIKAPEWIPRLVIDENTTVSGLGNNYTIEAKTIDFGITSIGQTVGDRGGKMTLEIDGAKFNSFMTAELTDSTGKSIVAENIWFEDSTEVFATFDLRNAAVGTYDLKLTQPSYSQTANGEIAPIISDILEDRFSVVDARQDNVLISVTSTPAVSPGQSFDIIVSYANRGTHDVTAPVIVLNASSDIRLENIQDGDEFAQFGSMALLGTSNEGPAGVLRPGETGIIRLRGTAPSTTGPINISARQMIDDGSPINYNDFIEYLGGDVSTKPWADAAGALRNQFGNSWTSFEKGLAERATELAEIGDYTHSATELWTDVALDAWGRTDSNDYATPLIENSILDTSSSVQLKNTIAIENGFSEVNNNVQSFSLESSSQFLNEDLSTNLAQTAYFPQGQIFEVVEAIAQVFGYPEDAAVGIKVPGGVEPIGRTGPAPNSSFDFTISLNDIGNPTLADVLDDLTGVNPAVDISSHALSIAKSVDVDKNTIRGLLALLEPYPAASDTLAQRAALQIDFGLDSIADLLALLSSYPGAFDTLMQRVEQKILATADQFENGGNTTIPILGEPFGLIKRPPAPTAGAALRHFVGELGSTPENLVNSYEESVKQAISATNPKAPFWFINKVIEVGKNYGAVWKTFNPTYPFAPNPTGHVHIDDDSALGIVVPNVDSARIPNNIVKDISESQEYKSEIDFLKKQLDSAVKRGFFLTIPEGSSYGPTIINIQVPTGKNSHTFDFDKNPNKAPIIPLRGIYYSSNEPSDFFQDTDVLLTLGQVSYQKNENSKTEGLYAVVNSIQITESSNRRNYQADVSVYGVDSYSWQNDDRDNARNSLWRGSGIDPVVFEYLWLTQQYGYGQPFTFSFQIDEITSGSVSIPDDYPPKKPPLPPTSYNSPNNSNQPGNPLNPFNPFDPGNSVTNVVVSRDPNDILGPQGFGAEHWVTSDPLNYTIRFENDPVFATAPAQVVRITQQLDSDLDFRTFRVGDFGFGDTFIDVPDNRAFYQTRLDLTATKGIYVDVVAGIDIATGQAFWELTSIDPTTGVEPTNPLQGFLPPNITKPEGDGFVSYSVKPKSSVENGAVIDAQARIIFDINEPIDTPAIFNTIDKSKPTSTVSALPSATNDTSFSVSWSGSDNTGGSALAGFTIYVSDNGGAFVPWLENTTLTKAAFTGIAGHSYAFYSRARDNAGNTEDAPKSPQASTTIAGGNPGTLAFGAGEFSISEDGTPIHAVTIIRTDGTTGSISATVTLSDDTAISPTDYNSTPIVVTFEPGETSKTVLIPIVNDTLIESAQKLNLVLGNPTGGATIGGQNSATVTIVDDDVQLAFSAATFSAIEDGTQEAAVTVIRTGRSSGAVSATITLSNGTATSPTDYDSTSIVVNFADGETTKTVVIPIVNDTVSESDEAIDLTLSSPTLGATIGTQSTATFIIKDNDTPLNLIGTPNNDTLVGAYGNDTLDGREGSDTLIGGAGNDTLIGGTGNDTLDGGIGNDSMDGGSGNDTYIVDSVADTVIENAGGGADTVQASVDFSIDGMSIENLILTGNAISGTGNNLSNRITGNAQNNILSGGIGYSDDTLDGGEGDDIMSGGYGHDTYIVDSPNDIIVENAAEGYDTVEVSVDYSIAGFANVENLILIGNAIRGTGNSVGNYLGGNALNNVLDGGEGDDTLDGYEGDDTLIGGVGNDYLYGYTGNDTLDGGTGDDRMLGGSGNDTYIVDSVNDTITENINEGTDTIKAAIDYSIAGLTNVEHLTLTLNAINGTGNYQSNRITGNDLDNVLSGGAGYDTLIGGAGNDTLIGGTGDDIYIVDSLNDTVVENANEGYDRIDASIDYSIAGLANIEHLTLTLNAINGTGNSLNNRIFGNSLDNTLIGDAGNDFLDGSTGNDTLIGGTGDDIYIVDSPNDTIVENALEGTSDWVQASVDYSIASFANIEWLTLTLNAINGTGNSQNNYFEGNALDNVLDGGEGDDSLNGLQGNDTIIGGAGNDTLAGEEGNDTLVGGNGNDSYYVDSTADTIIEELNAGTDSVWSSISWTLGENLEKLTLYGSNSINGTGNQLNNTITGNAANNILSGGLGYDNLYGEAGDDTLDGGEGSDSLNGGDGNDILDGGSDHDYLYGNAGNDTLNGGSGNDYLRGDAGNDTLNGGSGNDSLDGSTGNDVLAGDDGDDYYSVDSISDSILEAANAGTDTVSSSVSWTLGSHLENLTLTGTSTIAGVGNALNNTIRSNNYGNNLFGNDGNDTLIGGTGNDTLDGGTGNDRMEGGTGDDTYIVDSTTDTIIEFSNSGTDTVIASIDFSIAGLANIENLTLTGSAIGGTGNSLNNRMTGNALDNTLNGDSGNDTLIGDAGKDTLIGGTGNDTLDGGTGNDTMDGGSGDDTYIVDNTTDTIIENASSGTDTVIASIDFSIAGLLNIENLTLAGNATSATGNSLNNVITGNALDNTLNGGVGSDTLIGATGNDILDGGTGNDRMEGGIGDDTYIVDNTIDTIVENASSGLDTVEASVSFSIAGFTYVENLILTGSATSATGNSLNNVITGNSLNNTLNGGGGDDILNGGAGNDTLIGGVGNDTYIIDSLNDTITEYSSEGTDTVEAAIDFSIAGFTYVENLTLTGNATNGTGNSLNNRMTGNAQNNTLNGGGGDDILNGGAGNDTLIGGVSNDTYIIDSLNDTITENASEGTDTVEATIDFSIAALTNIEDLTLTGNAISGTGNSLNNRMTGNALDNTLDGGALNDTLIGGAGNDTLIGGTGNDTMDGGTGDDIYVVDTTSDIIIENASSGTDTIEASVSFSIAGLTYVENLTLTGGAISGTGNSLNNVITGNAQNNTLNGGAGNDTLIGGAGNDTLDGSTGNDVLSGGDGDDTYYVDSASDSITEAANAGTDTVNSSISWTLGDNLENLTLTGNSTIDGIGNALNNTITANSVSNNLFGHDGNDNLTGGVGNDLLDGGTGDDTLIGGSGNDTLIGGFGNDVLTGSTGVDFFVLNNPNTGVDSITDFSAVDDTLRVSAAGFGGGLTFGATITSSQFLIGSGAVAATNSSQRFIYNTTTGALFFDADGNQTGFGAVQVATLSNKPTIGTSDIFVTT